MDGVVDAARELPVTGEQRGQLAEVVEGGGVHVTHVAGRVRGRFTGTGVLPTGFEPVISTVTGWRPLRAGP